MMTTETKQDAMKILRLSAENVKRLSAVEIKPDGNMVVIGGANGAGKSSVLDSIMYALAGKSAIPAAPIRRGQKSAKITIELGGSERLTVERRFTAGGGTLEIKTAKGFKASSPQAILDSLCGKIAFDPLEFTRMQPNKQAETLRGVVGLDFSEIDAERERLYDERTAVSREAKALKARVDSIAISPETPLEEVSIANLMEELKRRSGLNLDNQKLRDGVRKLDSDLDQCRQGVDQARERIAEAERQLAAAHEWLATCEGIAADKAEELAKAEEKVAALQDADVSEIERQIRSAEGTNADVRRALERERLATEMAGKLGAAAGLTDRIEQLDADKTKALNEAQWPIIGLGFNESGVTFDGLPFEQASSAEQLRVSVAMGLALNPTLRVLLIRDGSLLDSESLRLVAEMAESADGQLWIERVGDGAECSVVIEDGHVKATETA